MTSIRANFPLFIGLFLLFTLSGCTDSPPSLVGTYAVKEKGEMKEFIRIQQQGKTYLMSEKQGGKWHDPQVVTPINKHYLERLLKKPVTVKFTGLGNKNAALIHVPKGWTSGTFTSHTGFWLATFFGPVELYKQK